jgi:hypothetical protein
MPGFRSTHVAEMFVMKKGNNFSADAKPMDGSLKCWSLQLYSKRKVQPILHTALE